MKIPASPTITGILCGVMAAFGWGAGFVAAKHGIQAGFTPEDLAMHRFLWTGLPMLVMAMTRGASDLGGVGWGRGMIITILSGPPQALLAYTGFTLVPLGHGTTIQPACAALFGLLLAAVFLREAIGARRLAGAAAIIVGLLVYGAESLTTIGRHGVAGDLLFVTAGIFWATFGILLRAWKIAGTRAAPAVGAISVLLYAPLYFIFVGIDNVVRMGWFENLLQIAVQGLLAGVLPIFLFARAVALLGAGRASTFPALVPVFGLIVGYLTLGVVPTLPQLIGLIPIIIGFRFALQ